MGTNNKNKRGRKKMSDLKYYYDIDEEKYVTPTRIEMPNGDVVNYDAKKGRINFSVFKDYIGYTLSLYENGQFHKDKVIKDVKPNDKGIMTLHF